MNVTENYMLQQMQQIAASMNTLPQTGNGKDKTGESGSFQDMMEQVGKSNSEKAPAKETEGKQPEKEKAEDVQPEKAPVQEKKEELKPEEMAANPNAVNLMSLFRPDVAENVQEEPVIEIPIQAVSEETVEGPDLALDGQLPMMDANVDAGVSAEVPMDKQSEGFQEVLDAAPETEAAPAEVPVEEAGQAERADKPQEIPDAEVRVETDDEPKAEVVDAEQPVFHEMESAPVKVGESYETVDTEKPDMEAKLTDVIRAAAQNGAERVEIRLAPQNLGSLTIEMAKDANGALQVVLHASNAKAAGVLSQHLDGLQAALRTYNQEEVRIEVQHNEESQQQHFRQADPDGRGQQQRQQQEQRREEHTGGDAFMQKLRLGLFGEI